MMVLNISFAQRIFLRVDWNGLQQYQWQMNESIRVDTNFIEGSRLYLNSFKSYNRYEIEIPGASIEFRTKNNFFISGGLNFNRVEFWDNSSTEDLTKSVSRFRLLRYSWNGYGGFYFRKSRLIKPFLAGGLSVTLQRARFNEDFNSNHVAYLDYFNDSPPFLSLLAKGGFRYGAMTLGMNYSISVTPTTSDRKLGRFTTLTLVSMSLDIYRSTYLKKTQYREKIETDDLKIKRSQVLKQSESGYFIGMPVYFLPVNRYISSWGSGTVNTTILVNEAPKFSWIPVVGFQSNKALNKKRTWYTHSLVGATLIHLNYQNVKTISISSYPLTPGADPINDIKYDVKVEYLSVFFSYGTGYKIKTSPRSYIFLEGGIQSYGISRKDKTEFEVPPLKKMLFTSSFQGGLKIKYFGIALQLDKNISKTDEYGFFKNFYCLSLKLMYDVSTR